MERRQWIASGLLAVLGLGCGEVLPSTTVAVDDCANDANIDDVTLMAWEFEESIHEMVICGSLTYQLLLALADTAQNLLLDPSGLPAAFEYDNGAYITTGEGVSMDMVFRYGPDTPGGTAGEDIAHNLFEVDSYLQGAETSQKGDVLVVQFTEPGPLVAMLGQGEAPSSPLMLTETDLLVIADNLMSLKVKAQIHVDHEVVTSVFTYDIDNPAVFVWDALSALRVDMNLVSSATGLRADQGQSMQTVSWDIAYGEVMKNLEGTIVAEITGGAFDYQVRYDYNAMFSTPDVEIMCLP